MAHDGTRRDYELPGSVPFENEGKTVAGWLMFWGVCIGAAITALAMALWIMWLVVVGVAVILLTIVVSRVTASMGLGQPRKRDNPPGPGEPDWYA